MLITMEAETTAGLRERRSWRRAALKALGLIVAAAALAACDSDSPDPTAPGGPEGPDPAEVTLESNQLDAGSTGVVVSDGFAQLELEPAVDDDGAIIPDRWVNLHVTVGGTEVDVRRLDERTMEFTVPILPGGDYGVDVASPFAHGSASARVFGVVASEQVVDCPLLPRTVALVPVGDALVFDTACFDPAVPGGEDIRVGMTWPAIPGRGFEWLPEGDVVEPSTWIAAGPSPRPGHFVARRGGFSEPPDFWVWEGGANPHPVEPLSCFGTVDVASHEAAPAEAGDGRCLLLSPGNDMIFRDGEPVVEWQGFNNPGHFVASDDGWVTTRGSRRLIVFDSAGELVVADTFGYVRDAGFASGGGPLYVATGQPFATEAMLHIVDRGTGDVLRETTLTGVITAIAASEDRLWIARTTGPSPGGELFVELLDPETLETRRSIVVASVLAADLGTFWPDHGDIPVLLEDATGTRLTYTGRYEGLWSHVVDVF